ncbi:DcaP family trimeric outer membrane transporter [Halomonas rhizosphaerae]|uniref:DcaP family trimeric outer membrane transporter n=1 Tax=Halomonas rhizosphaerae TaxID=3043296 RepID=A0ABT6UY16_9GAMM|nr:DcaP family trimeric outer membrane transporter [Halomonas rhizosphaerae]MDI5890860.1 DcaP family trimeric outer membrane transporter [Halomonas rhizosphaerae]
MTIQNRFKQTAIFSASALALAVASASHAVDFEVGDTTASVYGYAKLDMIYDVDAELGNSLVHENIRLDDADGSDGHTTLHAYQSRIGFKTSTPVAGSDLVTQIEGDFYGSGGGELRLRHAFGSWNGILAGQTWTNLYGFVAGTPTIDFTGTHGTGNQARQAQLRYTTGNFAVSLEEPDALGGVVDADYNFVRDVEFNDTVIAEEVAGGDAAKSKLPDLIARYTDTSGPFKYSASGVLRQLEYDADGQANAPANWSDDTATGWGITLEAAMDVTEALTLRGGVIHGEGLGDYQNVSPMPSPAYVNSDGELEAIEATGGTFGASLKAGPGAINAAYSISTVDLDDEEIDGNDTFETVHLNYIWSPAERISYGIETSWVGRETSGGDEGDAMRIQGMAMYSF